MFQTKFTFEDVPKYWRPWKLSSDDWTHLLEHVAKNPGTFTYRAAAVLSFERETMKGKDIFHTEFLCRMMEQNPKRQKDYDHSKVIFQKQTHFNG